MIGMVVLARGSICRSSVASSCQVEEGNLAFYVRGTFPINVAPRTRVSVPTCTRSCGISASCRMISQNGRPDDGTDRNRFYNLEFFLPAEAATVAPGERSKPVGAVRYRPTG